MLSNIEQAVIHLLNANQSITVSNVFAAYMGIAGHDISEKEKAVITFERAMDKHPLRPDMAQSPVIAKLRNQYWYDKLGGCKDGDGECSMCEHCGAMKIQDKNRREKKIRTGAPAVEVGRPSKMKVKKSKRILYPIKPDPYAPSTSTVCL